MKAQLIYMLGFSASLVQGMRKGFLMVSLKILLLEKGIS
jgi:hypothetical protein